PNHAKATIATRSMTRILLAPPDRGLSPNLTPRQWLPFRPRYASSSDHGLVHCGGCLRLSVRRDLPNAANFNLFVHGFGHHHGRSLPRWLLLGPPNSPAAGAIPTVISTARPGDNRHVETSHCPSVPCPAGVRTCGVSRCRRGAAGQGDVSSDRLPVDE